MREIVVEVFPARGEWCGEIKAAGIEKVLLAAMIGKEQLVLICDVLIDSKTGLRSNNVICHAVIQKILLCSSDAVAIGQPGLVAGTYPRIFCATPLILVILFNANGMRQVCPATTCVVEGSNICP